MFTAKSASVQILENDDRLTRPEFEQRYQAMPNVKKAELIEEVVYMPSPLQYRSHGQPHGYMMIWLGVYSVAAPGVELADNPTVRLDLDNEPQPDALLRLNSESGGQSRMSDDDCVEGAPEIIVEIASSSAAYDLRDKLRVYRRNGVEEYLVWQVYEQKLDWFKLGQGEYVPLALNEEGVIHSQTFPGLNLPVVALLAGDWTTVLAEVYKGIATEAHQNFVERLAQR